jgi:signal transduction histidine kinase
MLRVLLATDTPPPARRCADHCANNPWQLVHGDGADRLAFAAEAGWLVLGAAFVLVLGARLFRSSPRERRVQTVPLAAAFATAFAFVLLGAAGSTAGGVGGNDARTQVLQAATVLAVPVAFLVGLLRERLSHAQVADLVRALERAPLEELGARVARALGDPSAQVIFPLSGGYVDPAGRPAVLPAAASARRVTPLGDGDSPLALLVHDRQLEREPSLLAAAGAATRLTVENARLHAKVRAQLAEVRASRARLVSAGDAERRRLERDLHDGAQQRLLTLGVLLRLLANQIHGDPGAEGAELIREAQAELSAAVEELRQLARGIHPAVLTDLGLPAAVQQLAERSTLPVVVAAPLGRRLAADIESTGYFVVSEGIANAAKYAGATEVRVTIGPAGAGLLRITVADDGVGGADPAAGSGLRGLADRLASIDGTLSVHSPCGGGTVLTADLPLR